MKSKKMATITAVCLIAAFLLTTGFTFVPLRMAALSSAGNEEVVMLPLSDIKGHWAEAGIMEMYARDVMTGYENGTFRPNKQVTYLDGVVMLNKLLWGKPPKIDFETNGYLQEDFKIPVWAVGYIASALRNRVIYYNELEKVSSAQPLTRQEIAVLVVRALELTGKLDAVNDLKLSFTDAGEISYDLKGYVSIVNQLGIMNGFPRGSFKPKGTVSRAEMAKILNRTADFISYLKNDEISGFIKTVNLSDKSVTLNSMDGKEFKVILPERYFTYMNDKAIAFDKLMPGVYLRVIKSNSRNTAVLLAQSINADEGTPVSFEQVLMFPAADVQRWVEENKANEGFSVKIFGNKIYLLATRGEKMTGGYKIDIRKMSFKQNEDGGLDYKVYVFLSDPGRDSVVNQVISYPYSLVCFDKPGKPVNTLILVDELNRTLAEVKI